jgi:hypothetical protein
LGCFRGGIEAAERDDGAVFVVLIERVGGDRQRFERRDGFLPTGAVVSRLPRLATTGVLARLSASPGDARCKANDAREATTNRLGQISLVARWVKAFAGTQNSRASRDRSRLSRIMVFSPIVRDGLPCRVGMGPS